MIMIMIMMTIRSTEVVMSLVTEAIYWSQAPDPVTALGCLLVTACVAAMAAHDNIVKKIKNMLQKENEFSS